MDRFQVYECFFQKDGFEYEGFVVAKETAHGLEVIIDPRTTQPRWMEKAIDEVVLALGDARVVFTPTGEDLAIYEAMGVREEEIADHREDTGFERDDDGIVVTGVYGTWDLFKNRGVEIRQFRPRDYS